MEYFLDNSHEIQSDRTDLLNYTRKYLTTENLAKNSIVKMKKKNCDLIFANDISRKDVGFNSNYNKVSVIDKKGNINVLSKNKKSFIANKIAEILLDKLLIDDRNIN